MGTALIGRRALEDPRRRSGSCRSCELQEFSAALTNRSDCGHIYGRNQAMKQLIAVIPGTLLATLAWSQIPAADDAKEPRDLGHTAVMHVYWYAPKTTEITHVETYLFKD